MKANPKQAPKEIPTEAPAEAGMLTTDTLFGIPMYSLQLRQFSAHRDALAHHLTALREQAPGVEKSNVRGWHSKENLHRSEHPSLQWLTSKINNVANATPGRKARVAAGTRLEVVGMWANINETGGWNAPHHHLPCEWSGSVYIATESSDARRGNKIEDGQIMFINPMPLPPRFNRPATITYPTREGSLLLFPAYLMHMVTPHYSERSRISIAFNLMSVQANGDGEQD